jgi:drug/metabolite transporter (DMT)-like permease
VKREKKTIATQKFFEAGISLFLFGCVPVTIKYISANAFTIGVFRLGTASLCLLLFLRIKGAFFRIRMRDLSVLAILGLLFGSHWMTHFLSIKISSASVASIGLSTYGVHLIMLGWFFRKNRIHITDLIAVFLAALGSILIIPEFTLSNDTSLGAALGIISGLFYAILPVIHQKYAGITHSMRAFGQFFFGFLFFLLFFPMTEWNLPRQDWLWLIFLGLVCTFIAHTLWVRVTTVLSTITTSVVFYLFVPITMILSYFILDEPMTVGKITGAILVVAGNMVGLYKQWKREALIAAIEVTSPWNRT